MVLQKVIITRYSNDYHNKGLLCANEYINTNVSLMFSFAKIKCPALVLHIYFQNFEPALMLVVFALYLVQQKVLMIFFAIVKKHYILFFLSSMGYIWMTVHNFGMSKVQESEAVLFY